MAANHEALGLNVRIKECSVFDALGISSDLDEMSKEKGYTYSSRSLLEKLWNMK